MFHYRDNSSFDLITSWQEKKNPCALISLHSTNLVKSSAGITTKQVDEKKNESFGFAGKGPTSLNKQHQVVFPN